MEKEDDVDTESEEGGKGRKKKWGRSKDKGSAEAPPAGDKEVSPSGSSAKRMVCKMGRAAKIGRKPCR